MHTPDIIKNPVYGFLLNKAWFNRSIGVDLYTITKNDIFVKLLCLRLLRMKLKLNLVRLRDFVVIWECILF